MASAESREDVVVVYEKQIIREFEKGADYKELMSIIDKAMLPEKERESLRISTARLLL